MVPMGKLFSESLDAASTESSHARLIWHDVGTVTGTQHLHADKSTDGHRYEAGEKNTRGRAVYRPVGGKP